MHIFVWMSPSDWSDGRGPSIWRESRGADPRNAMGSLGWPLRARAWRRRREIPAASVSRARQQGRGGERPGAADCGPEAGGPGPAGAPGVGVRPPACEACSPRGGGGAFGAHCCRAGGEDGRPRRPQPAPPRPPGLAPRRDTGRPSRLSTSGCPRQNAAFPFSRPRSPVRGRTPGPGKVSGSGRSPPPSPTPGPGPGTQPALLPLLPLTVCRARAPGGCCHGAAAAGAGGRTRGAAAGALAHANGSRGGVFFR